MAIQIPSAQVLLAIDVETAAGGTISSPSPQMATWLLPIPSGQNALQVAAEFADAQKYPAGTTAIVVDFSATPTAVEEFQLQTTWVAV